MVKVIELIIKDIVNKLNSENIISFTPVGSLSNNIKKLNKFNDLDLVIIYNKINKSNLKKLNEIVKSIKERYSTLDIGITHTFKIGPIKLLSEKPKTIMIHFLVYSVDSYLKYESNLTRFSFQHYKNLIGKPLSQLSKSETIGQEDLFNNMDGIPAIKRWILSKEGEYIEPIGDKLKFGKLKLENTQYLEIIFYSILRLASNMVRLKRGYIELDKNMCEKFSKEFQIKMRDFPTEVLKLKNILRNGRKFDSNKINELKIMSLEFVKECEGILKRYKS